MFLKLIKPVDDILNLVTMYRLVLYYLLVLVGFAAFLSFFKLFSFSFLDLFLSSIFIIASCWLTNLIFSKTFNAITNLESVYISALILILIITPAKSFSEYVFLFVVSLIAMSSKYIFAIYEKHIFNPVALAIFLTSILNIGFASWWIGTTSMIAPVLIGGILIVRKIKRFDLLYGFLITAFITIVSLSFLNSQDILTTALKTFQHTPILFLALVMLTEPLTTPPTKRLQIIYGAITGFFFAPQLKLFSFYTTPEIALLIGNLYSYLVSPKQKLILTLKEKVKLTQDTYDFIFSSDKKFKFVPGQYLEWTLSVDNPDSRGNRRYFTIASAPSEENIRTGIKFYPNSSKFKQQLINLNIGEKILAGSLSGDFVLPKNLNKNIVFMAGGIGITPFRSMIKQLVNNNTKISLTIFYSNKTQGDIVYTGILNEASRALNSKVVYNLTDLDKIPQGWTGERGRINEEIIRTHVPDYKNAIFYLSGPRSMVEGFGNVLNKLGVSFSNIKTDFFTGYA